MFLKKASKRQGYEATLHTTFLYLNDTCVELYYAFMGNSNDTSLTLKVKHEVGYVWTGKLPLNTWRNDNVVITSKRRHLGVITPKRLCFYVIMTPLFRNVSAGLLNRSAGWKNQINAPPSIVFQSFIGLLRKMSRQRPLFYISLLPWDETAKYDSWGCKIK